MTSSDGSPATFRFPGPLPEARGEEAVFFAHARQGRLMIQRCAACGHHIFYPRAACPHCWALHPEWVEATGRGTVFTYTVQHRDLPGYEGGAPFVLAMIELEEGVRIMARLVCDPDEAAIGMPVAVEFAAIESHAPIPGDDDFVVPVFVPERGDV